ncbi:MAG TPA: hypothetical protein VLM89_15180 [Phycisphaerae bacterium]|nr:hypothetical protein [Phycisphaerae bacterium]
MKVTCPKCRKVVQAPDEWAGRKVKCPGCKDLIKLPESVDGSTADDLNFDFRSLGSLESVGETMIRERKGKPLSLKEAQKLTAEAAAENAEPLPADPAIRICPKCRHRVRCADPYAEVMCGYCGTGIPGTSDNANKTKYKAEYDADKNLVTFYGGFTSAVAYPVPAFGSIFLGMAIGFGSITVPLLAVLGFIAAANLNPVGQDKGGADYGWVGVFINAMFLVQAIYFGSVAYYLLIDTIRTTSSGSENPPNLSWNIINLGAALGGYAILVTGYAMVIILLVTASTGSFPTQVADLTKTFERPVNLAILALLTFGVPMNLLGLASGTPLFGLHPYRVGLSILNSIGHYTFLFLIFLLYLGIYIGVMAAVLSWAGPAILQTASQGLKAGLANMLGGLAAWAVVLGAGFFFAYSIGRILGLFARTYKKSLCFED